VRRDWCSHCPLLRVSRWAWNHDALKIHEGTGSTRRDASGL